MLACARLCACAWVRRASRRAWHVRRATARSDCAALIALTYDHTPPRFGRLKDDTTVLVVDVDLRGEEVRRAAAKKGSCCIVC